MGSFGGRREDRVGDDAAPRGLMFPGCAFRCPTCSGVSQAAGVPSTWQVCHPQFSHSCQLTPAVARGTMNLCQLTLEPGRGGPQNGIEEPASPRPCGAVTAGDEHLRPGSEPVVAA